MYCGKDSLFTPNILASLASLESLYLYPQSPLYQGPIETSTEGLDETSLET